MGRAGQVACALYSIVARRLLDGQDDRAAALADARRALPGLRDQRVHPAPRRPRPPRGVSEASGRGVVWDSFWSAWDAFAGANDYREAIQRAVAYGNDTDTTAAIAGGLAGIRGASLASPWSGSLADARPRDRRTARHQIDESRGPDPGGLGRPRESPGLAGSPGRLGMTFLPGKKGRACRAITTATSFATFVGCAEFSVSIRSSSSSRITSYLRSMYQHRQVMAEQGIELIRFPDPGDRVRRLRPSQPRSATSVHASQWGQNVAVACRGLRPNWHGRRLSPPDVGLGGDEAIALTRASRHAPSRTTTRNDL